MKDPVIRMLADLGFNEPKLIDGVYSHNVNGAYQEIMDHEVDAARAKVKAHAKKMQDAAAEFDAAFPYNGDVGGIKVYNF